MGAFPGRRHQARPSLPSARRRTPHSPVRRAHPLLDLQRTVGNQVVQRMVRSSMNQRGDRYEQEADRVAEQVVGAPHSATMQLAPAARGMPLLTGEHQDGGGRGSDQLRDVPPLVSEAINAPARPLDGETRAFMESRFGHDFSQVRLHTDARAGEAARMVNARAFTVGKDVVVDQRQGGLGTPAGLRLLAHELAHVVQQGQGQPVLQKQPRRPARPEEEMITSGPEFEAELAEFEKLKQRFEEARARHEERIAPLPLEVLPLDVLKRAGVKTTTRVGKSTASLIHSVLERSRVLRPYIERKLGRRRIPGKQFVIHDSDAEFEAHYTRLHKIVIPVGSAAEKELKTKYGFYHPQTDTIHLRPTSNVGHALHEAIHKFASRGFRNIFGGFLDEGVTQYFTDLVLEEQGLDRMKGHLYEDQAECASKLVDLFSHDLVARAYFQGDTALATRVAGRLNVDFAGLYRLRSGDSLCKRLKNLRP